MFRRTTQKTLITFLGNSFSFALVILMLFRSVAASTATDSFTPLALTPGAPAASYPLSGLDNINLNNGNLNFHLPLLAVGGRGSASFTITRVIEQHWRVDHTILPDLREINTPFFNPWTPLEASYSPGALYGRKVNDGSCSQGAQQAGTLTRLTFVAPDGTEYELIDKLTGGQIGTSFCWAGLGFARGTVFVTADGTSVTFVSDSTINDNQFGSPVPFYPTGYLMLPDGMRYRMVNGRVEWLRDRNGNQVNITYPTSTRMIATDQLGRQVIVDRNFSDIAPYGLCDKITFNGFNGVQRFIRVSKKNLGTVLQAGLSLQTPAVLFPGLDGSSSTNHDPQVVSAIWLPDGRSYQFRYNSYGELARVELPTGGAFEYDYAAGLVNGAASGVFTTFLIPASEIYRRVVEKRIYKEGGVLENKTIISRTDSQFSTDTTVTVDTRNPGGTLLTRSKHYFFGNPAQSFDIPALNYPQWKHGREFRTEAFDTNGSTVLRRTEHTWQQPIAGATWPLSQPESNDFAKANNPQITQTLTILEPASVNQVAKQSFAFDQYSNKTDVWEYGFGTGSPPANATRRRQTSYLTTNPFNFIDYASPNPTATSIHLRNLPQHERVYSVNPANGQETQIAHTEVRYDETVLDPLYGTVTQWIDPGVARGNATKVRRLLNPGSTWLESRNQFDQVGNVSKSWDPKNNQTQIAYSSTYHFAYPTQTTSAVPDPTGLYGSTTAFVATRVYDLSTGLVTSTTDGNNQTTNISYNDVLGRPTQVSRAVGSSIPTQTTFGYDDVNRIITITGDLHAHNDNILKDESRYDGLGRTVEARHYEGGSNYSAKKTEYDALGRPFRTSNAFSPWKGETAVWTTQAFDALSRVISVTTPDNAVVSTSYSGNSVTVTDQAGKKRKSVSDALGRLREVYEDPNPGGLNYQTTFDYDGLDNLVKVTQGIQQRFFMYDSLGRVLRTRNPEHATLPSLALTDPISGNNDWSIGYQYDANGNVIVKTDARGVVSTHAYDALNRITTTNYSDTAIDPDVKRAYDGATNGKGRFWYFYSGGDFSTGPNVDHTSIDSYDVLGRPLVQRQLFKINNVWFSPATPYQVSRTYNRAGRVTSQIYPSGNSVTYNYDNAGRLADKDAQNLAFTGNLGSLPRTYSRGISYVSSGQLKQEQFGTDAAVYHKLHYNVRKQLCDVRASNVNDEWGGELGALVNHYSTAWAHCGSGADNNGNVLMSQTIINSVYFEDRYSYDSLNRLTAVSEYLNGSTLSGSQQYSYDRWGNRTIIPSSPAIGLNTSFEKQDTTNRLYAPGDLALADASRKIRYDNAGNQIKDIYTGFGTANFDAENRITAIQNSSSGWSNYTYNAHGNRTRRTTNNSETWQIYGFDGELLAEYPANGPTNKPQKEYGYRNGQLLVTAAMETIWSDDAVPAGAALAGDGEGWNWVSSNPAPFSGSTAHQSNIVAGLHQHFFYGSPTTLSVNAGDKLFAYVYLDPSNMPSQIMLQWAEGGSWEHRAYWGANNLPWGTDGTNSRRYMGPLPAAGTWVKLEVPASLVGLEGYTLHGMAFSMWGGRATWDRAGKTPSAPLNWLITDHLGTPRIIIEKTGSLANVKRHDYLPFGEEMFAPIGGRTTGLGYASGDGVRQQFTGQERDIETSLDYFLARYFSSKQGRFVAADSFRGWIHNPQTLNRYAYVANNPLRFIDPSGNITVDSQNALYVNPQRYPGLCGPGCQDPKPTEPKVGPDGQLKNEDGSPYVLPAENVNVGIDPIKVISDPPAEQPKLKWWQKALAWLGIGGGAAAGGGAAGGGGAGAAAGAGAGGAGMTIAGAGATRFLADQEIYDLNGQLIGQGTVDLGPTFERIARGELDTHPNDGSVFKNKEQLLPVQPEGYYQEWVVRIPNYPHVGPQRLITGSGGEIWYTPDHYRTFTPINDAAVRCGCGPGGGN